MAKRRQFIFSFAGTAALLLLLCGLWPRGVAIDEIEAQAILRNWLAADYRQSSEDPLLREPSISSSNDMPPIASSSETTPIAFKHFETRRPFIRPSDARHAALVRVEVIYNGITPSDGEASRCFLLAQKENEAWQVRREISESAFRWRLGF